MKTLKRLFVLAMLMVVGMFVVTQSMNANTVHADLDDAVPVLINH